MDSVINQIAEALKISVDKATEIYPVIREQWVWSSSIETIRIYIFLFIPSSIVIAIMLMGEASSASKEIKSKFNRYAKILFVIFIILSLIFITLSVLRVVMAPDLSLLMEFVK